MQRERAFRLTEFKLRGFRCQRVVRRLKAESSIGPSTEAHTVYAYFEVRQGCEKLSRDGLKQSNLQFKIQHKTIKRACPKPVMTFSLIPGQRCNPVSTFLSHCRGGRSRDSDNIKSSACFERVAHKRGLPGLMMTFSLANLGELISSCARSLNLLTFSRELSPSCC